MGGKRTTFFSPLVTNRKRMRHVDFIKVIRTAVFDDRARMSGTYPISTEILDKPRVRESAVSSIAATLGFRVEVRRFQAWKRPTARANEGESRLRGEAIPPCMNIQYREPAWFRKPLLFIETFSSLDTVIDNRPRKEFPFFSRFRHTARKSRYVYSSSSPSHCLFTVTTCLLFCSCLLLLLRRSLYINSISTIPSLFFCCCYKVFISCSYIDGETIVFVILLLREGIDIFRFNGNAHSLFVYNPPLFVDYVFTNFAKLIFIKIDHFFLSPTVAVKFSLRA